MEPDFPVDPLQEAGQPPVSPFADGFTSRGLAPRSALTQVDTEVRLKELQKAPPTFLEVGQAVNDRVLSVAIADALHAPRFEVDPTFTDQRREELFKQVLKTRELPEKYHSQLYDAVSEAHFKHLYDTAKYYANAERITSEYGWSGMAMELFANIADPANLIAGALTFKLIHRMTLLQSVWRQVAAQGLGGAALTAASLRVAESTGQAFDGTEYILATGMGLAFGAAFGNGIGKAITYDPTVRDGLAKIHKAGQGLIDRSVKIPEEILQAPKPPTHAQVKEAVDATFTPADVASRAAFNEPARVPETPVLEAPVTARPVNRPVAAAPDQSYEDVNLYPNLQGSGPADALFAAGIDKKRFDQLLAELRKLKKVDLDAILNDYRNRPTGGTFVWKSKNKDDAIKQIRDTFTERHASVSKRRVIERITQWHDPKAPEAPPVAWATKAPDMETPYVLRELEPTDAHLKSSRFVSRYEGPDGNEYRIMAQTDDMSGPFKIESIVKGKLSTVTRDLDSVQEAVASLRAKFDNAEIAPPKPKETKATAPVKAADPPDRAQAAVEGPLSRIGLGQREQDLLSKLPPTKMSGKQMAEWMRLNEVKATSKVRTEMADDIADAIVPGRALDASGGGPEAAERNRLRAALTKRMLNGDVDDIIPPLTGLGRAVNTSPEPVRTTVPVAQDAGAAVTPNTGYVPLQDKPEWLSISDDLVPKTAMAGVRRDLAARLDSVVPQIRLVKNFLLNDVVGKVGHRLNAWSADQAQRRQFGMWMSEWHRSRHVAFRDWVSRQPEGRLAIIRAKEFHEQVTRYVKNPTAVDADYDPAVVQLGKATQQLHKKILEDLKDPGRAIGLPGQLQPVKAVEDIEENLHYIWRNYDEAKFSRALVMYGDGNVTLLFRQAIAAAQPDIDPLMLDRLAAGMVRNIKNRANNLGDDMITTLGEGRRAHLAKMLRDDAQLSDAEVEFMMGRLFKNTGQGDMMHTKSRILLDERTSIDTPVDKQGNALPPLSFSHILNEDVEALVTAYARRMSGRVALARTRIQLPAYKDTVTTVHRLADGTQVQRQSVVDRPGVTIVDGIQDLSQIDEIMVAMKKSAGDYHAMNPDTYTAAQRDFEIEELQYAFDHILGRPEVQKSTTLAQGLLIWRRFNAMRLMNNVGIAQMGEYGSAIGTFGVKAALTHLPAFRRIVAGDGTLQYANALGREIESMGIGIERITGIRWSNPYDHGNVPMQMPATGVMAHADRLSKLGEEFTYSMSGMKFIQQKQEMGVAAMFAQKFADLGADLAKGKPISRGWVSRFRQLGLSDDMIAKISKELRDHTTFESSMFYRNGKIGRLNMNNWGDLEARAHFEQAMYRFTKKLVQDHTLGNSWKFMRDPVLATIFQFRPFMFQAWSNHMLYNVHMRDPAALLNFTWAVTWAAAIRALQVQALAIGRPDAAEWKEKELSPLKLGTVGFQRAAWSSLIPSAIDTPLNALGQGGLFNERNSGLASSFFDNPTMGFERTMRRGIGGMVNSFVDGRELSQPEYKALVSMLPFSNGMAIQIPLQVMISGAPERAPRQVNRIWQD